MKNENLVPKVRFKGFSDPWEQRKLGEMYYFKNGLNKGKEFFGFGTPIVNFVDVFHNRGLYAQNLNGRVNLTEKEINNFRVHKGDIFFTRTSETIEEIGFPSVMLSEPQDTVFSGFVLRGRSLEKPGQLVNIFKKYVFFTNAFRKEMVTKSSMTTRALTSGTALSAMRVKFPLEATEQKKIGELITRLDYLIAANEDKLEQLKTLKKLMMQKIFSQKWRFKGFTDPWEQRKLGELSNGFTYGLNASAKAYDGKHQYLRITDIDDETRTFKQTHLTSPDIDFIRDNSYVLKLGDIVFTRTGASTGKTFIYRTADSIVYYAGFLIKMSVREDIDSEFVFQNTLTTSFNRFVKVMSQRSGQPGINSKEYARFKLYIPKLKEQVLVGNMLLLIDNLIAANEDKLNQLKKLKKYLMQNMFV